MRVMGGELRVNSVGHAKQFARVGDIGNVRCGLGGEDRKPVHTNHLRVFDLGVPIGAFDEPNHDLAICALCHVIKRINHQRGARAVGLHHDAKAVPALQGRFGQDGLNHV